MNTTERGFLLLCGDLADSMTPLSLHRLDLLQKRMQLTEPPADAGEALSAAFFRSLGYPDADAARLTALFDREAVLEQYLALGAQKGCFPLTRVSEGFPQYLREKLGKRCPAVLFYRGNLSLLQGRKITLVGSRTLESPGAAFAAKVGELAAKEGFTLVSGNAWGADRTAQDACLQNGGSVISVVSEPLCAHEPASGRILYLAESGWHQTFTPARALGRNRLIHALGERSFVAQSACSGGTWQGTSDALKHALTPVFVNDDGSEGARALCALGAQSVRLDALQSLSGDAEEQLVFFRS